MTIEKKLLLLTILPVICLGLALVIFPKISSLERPKEMVSLGEVLESLTPYELVEDNFGWAENIQLSKGDKVGILNTSSRDSGGEELINCMLPNRQGDFIGGQEVWLPKRKLRFLPLEARVLVSGLTLPQTQPQKAERIISLNYSLTTPAYLVVINKKQTVEKMKKRSPEIRLLKREFHFREWEETLKQSPHLSVEKTSLVEPAEMVPEATSAVSRLELATNEVSATPAPTPNPILTPVSKPFPYWSMVLLAGTREKVDNYIVLFKDPSIKVVELKVFLHRRVKQYGITRELFVAFCDPSDLESLPFKWIEDYKTLRKDQALASGEDFLPETQRIKIDDLEFRLRQISEPFPPELLLVSSAAFPKK